MPVYPRWRGEHARAGSSKRPSNRFIPAGAGNTIGFPFNVIPNSVYPRWRGEHRRLALALNVSAGLSPLARGTPTRHHTPVFWISVYPRWRGEHPLTNTRIFWCVGLSPLARGTPQEGAEGAARARFIPAGAGNTSPHRIVLLVSTVYPRWRGEH